MTATNKQAKRKKYVALSGQIIPPREPKTEDPLDHWVLWVGDAWREAARNIVETGRRIAKLYALYEEEGQRAIVERLKISQPMVSKLMSIGANRVLIEYSHGEYFHKLPPSWTTIYELSKMDEAELREKLESGEINSNTERKDIEAMRKAGPEDELEPNQRQKKTLLNDWDVFSDELEQFDAVINKLNSTILNKVKSSGEYEKEFVKADGAIDGYVTQLNAFIEKLNKLKEILRIGPAPIHSGIHIGPRGRRRK